MALDETDFIDPDFQAARNGPTTVAPAVAGSRRAPTREELDSQLTSTQQQLAKLREAQEQLERARVAVEELRRRRAEFQNGRDEMRQLLTRGIGLMEKSEFESRRAAEQMARSLEGLRGALESVEGLNDQAWTDQTWDQELSKALVTVENARMEWNSARLKWPVLDGTSTNAQSADSRPELIRETLSALSIGQLCRLGLALSWPLALVGLLSLTVFLILLFRR